MHTENTVYIQGAPERIFALAADIAHGRACCPITAR